MFKIVILLLLSVSTSVFASEFELSDEERLSKAKDKLAQTYSHMNVTQFKKGPIPGTFELITGNKVIYYHPEAELLIFGEIYDKTGNSITAASRKAIQEEKLKDLDSTVALKMGDGDKTIIEFTNPDCTYCRKLNTFLFNKGKSVKREIYFSLAGNGNSKANAKAVHILCANDPEAEFQRVFNNEVKVTDMLSCKEGKEKLAAHRRISDEFGVSGTPTLVLGDSVITGFRQAQIARFLE